MLEPSSLLFNDTATTEIYTLALHDALPICHRDERSLLLDPDERRPRSPRTRWGQEARLRAVREIGSAHAELQSRQYLVCRLLLEKKTGQLDRRGLTAPPERAVTPPNGRV